MSSAVADSADTQEQRNAALLSATKYLRPEIQSQVLPFHVDVATTVRLPKGKLLALEALQIEAAATSIRTLSELAKLNEVDHLGGGLELIPALLLTAVVTDFEKIEYTIEHAHTSIGYYSVLAAMGYVAKQAVIEGFRRGLDIPGHVSWLPGGTQLNGGRLGVMIPVAVGQALGKRAKYGEGAWGITHCGDAGWISGQALNGFNAADVHGAPITFVMHRNGIQLSGSTKSIMDKDPRGVIESLGVEVLEIPSLHDVENLYSAYRQGYELAQTGRPSIIYPVGYRSGNGQLSTLESFAVGYGISDQMKALACANNIALDTEVWVPGSLMSFRDVEPMLECLFLVNQLPGGKGHHDGHMKGRDCEQVLANPMLSCSRVQQEALEELRGQSPHRVVTSKRPAPGSANLKLPASAIVGVELPQPGDSESPRSGSEAGYAALAKNFPEKVFVVSCDLDSSTKLAKARSFLAADHQFEMSIEEQAATLMANGLALSGSGAQLNVVSTFAAFFEGIAREGFDVWRYQRNLNGVNEGLNVTFHLSHVGACTGRDHFSGWGLDWINVGLAYLPYLHRFYAPADARAAFLAVVDLAAHYGGHIIGIPRDNLPILSKQGGNEPLWNLDDAWEEITMLRNCDGARRAILAFGAPAFLAAEAAEALTSDGTPTDVLVVNGLPLSAGRLASAVSFYTDGVVTVEDGLIGTADSGLRGFAGLVAGAASDIPCDHVGIADPSTAPSEGHMETWKHFGITADALYRAVQGL